MKRVVLVFLVVGLCLPAFAQQEHVNKYDVFTGFTYMISPARNLTERGFNPEFGVNIKRWLSLGGDFSVLVGAGDVFARHTVFEPLLAPLPPTLNPAVPFDSTTYTFAAGPQFNIRKWNKVTLFVRPGLGGIHERATLNLAPLAQLAQLGIVLPALNPKQNDTKVFFGFGGGFDLNVSRPVAIRVTADWVNTHLFSDLLPQRQNYFRFSIGPAFRWGELK
jgi:hypothetical protein